MGCSSRSHAPAPAVALLLLLVLLLAPAPRSALALSLGAPPGAPAGASAQAPDGQPAVAPGAVVALRGTPHLWIAGAGGVLHWAGDTRALAGREVDWSDRREVGVEELRRAPRGAPWLSAALVKLGEPIFLPKWETGADFPTLLRVRSIEDLELFGIDARTYGDLVLDEGAWELRYGFAVERLPRGELAPAVPAAAGAGPDPRSREYVTRPIPGQDGQPYTYVPYWATQVGDPRLLVGLALVATYNEAWREQVGARLDDRETTIVFGALPERVGGTYAVAANRITVNAAFSDDPATIASVLAHEVYHAVTPKERDAAGCFAEEIAAFTWQANTWSTLPAARRASSILGPFNDALVRALRAERVDDYVLATPSYRQQCEGQGR